MQRMTLVVPGTTASGENIMLRIIIATTSNVQRYIGRKPRELVSLKMGE
jgi:hypothetical protein